MTKNLHGFSEEHVKLIRETVASEAVSEAEFQRFLYRASKLGLDPLDGQIHLLARNQRTPEGKWEKTNVIIIGIDGFRAIAERSGKLAGVVKEPVYNEQGKLVRATAKVYRKDWQEPAVESLPLREYCKTKDGRPVGMWATMPETLLKKCAEAAAYRMAFAAELGGGVYIEEELDKNSQPLNNGVKEENPAPGEKHADTQEKEQPDSPNDETTDKNELKEFKKELILLDEPQYIKKHNDTVAPAFSADEDESYFLIGANENLQANTTLLVTGKIDKNNHVYVDLCEEVEEPKEPELELYYKDGPKDGKKATYVLGEDKNGNQYYISASGELAEKLKKEIAKINPGDLLKVTGDIKETSKGTRVEVKSIST